MDKIAEALHLKGHKHDEEHPESSTAPESDAVKKEPEFDASQITVLFVLGGPGAGKKPFIPTIRPRWPTSLIAGKGTQCANLVKDFAFCHLSGGSSFCMIILSHSFTCPALSW